jgi:hypothetical protein
MRTLLIPLCAMMLAACGPSQTSQAPAAATNATPFHPVASVKDLMNWIIDPNADALWGSVGTVISEDGHEEFHPISDEQWAALRNSAAIVAESGNLLMMKGRAIEEDEWMKASRGLIDAAMLVVQATEAKDKDALFDAGGTLYEACTACHSKYALGTVRDAQH